MCNYSTHVICTALFLLAFYYYMKFLFFQVEYIMRTSTCSWFIHIICPLLIGAYFNTLNHKNKHFDCEWIRVVIYFNCSLSWGWALISFVRIRVPGGHIAIVKINFKYFLNGLGVSHILSPISLLNLSCFVGLSTHSFPTGNIIYII